MIRREKAIKILEDEKKDRIYMKELIETGLDLLEEDEIKLIKLRYFSKPTRQWIGIAFELNKALDTCIKANAKILTKLASVISD